MQLHARGKLATRVRSLTVLLTGVVLGSGLSMTYAALAERNAVSWETARLFAEVFERVKVAYVDEVTDRELAESAARGMMAGLDTHSTYLDPQEYEELRMSTAGAYAGVGVEISLEAGRIQVMNAIDDSPAARAGIRSGDVIVAVDDVPVDAEHLEESVDRMRGKPGTRVKLTLNRLEQGQPVSLSITRSTVRVQSVKQQELEPGYAYVRITQFSETTAADFDAALKKLQDAPLRGVVLDLRGNPGGVLEAATQVVDAMLDSGVIVTADGRSPDARFTVNAQPGDALKGAPIAVLVDGSSASAAEIVAGALKDHKRGVLIGTTTYGKGSVQTVMPLSDGGALKLTTSRYHTPSGIAINQIGIAPDVTLSNADVLASQAEANAVSLLKEDGAVRVALATLKRSKVALDASTIR